MEYFHDNIQTTPSYTHRTQNIDLVQHAQMFRVGVGYRETETLHDPESSKRFFILVWKQCTHDTYINKNMETRYTLLEEKESQCP